jgi:hypothetical protein
VYSNSIVAGLGEDCANKLGKNVLHLQFAVFIVDNSLSECQTENKGSSLFDEIVNSINQYVPTDVCNKGHQSKIMLGAIILLIKCVIVGSVCCVRDR